MYALFGFRDFIVEEITFSSTRKEFIRALVLYCKLGKMAISLIRVQIEAKTLFKIFVLLEKLE